MTEIEHDLFGKELAVETRTTVLVPRTHIKAECGSYV